MDRTRVVTSISVFGYYRYRQWSSHYLYFKFSSSPCFTPNKPKHSLNEMCKVSTRQKNCDIKIPSSFSVCVLWEVYVIIQIENERIIDPTPMYNYINIITNEYGLQDHINYYRGEN